MVIGRFRKIRNNWLRPRINQAIGPGFGTNGLCVVALVRIAVCKGWKVKHLPDLAGIDDYSPIQKMRPFCLTARDWKMEYSDNKDCMGQNGNEKAPERPIIMVQVR